MRLKTQLLRLLAITPQINVGFPIWRAMNPRIQRLSICGELLQDLEDIKDNYYDGLDCGWGSLVEKMDFEEVLDYWDGLTQVFEWAKRLFHLHLCWEPRLVSTRGMEFKK